MNRHTVRVFAAFARDLPMIERFQAAKVVAEQHCGGPFDADEQALSDAIVAMAVGKAWFHGGMLGRTPGDHLLPASATGADPRDCRMEILDRTKYVYVTPSREVAQTYADLAKGVVYSVEPIGPIVVDPTELRTFWLVARAFGPVKELRKAKPEWAARAMASHVKGFACAQAVVLK